MHRVTDMLGAPDVRRYREIHRLQEAGEWDAADALVAALDDRILIGHVLAQRYLHPTHYISTFDELRVWLDAFSDHPGAGRIYRLANRKRPDGAPAPRRPELGALRGTGMVGSDAAVPLPRRELSEDRRRIVNDLSTLVMRQVAQGDAGRASRTLSRQVLHDGLSAAEYDAMRVRVARAYFAENEDRQALTLAERAAKRSGGLVPESYWTAGLAAWRLGDTERAAEHFALLANSERVDTELRAGGAYWAARANALLNRPLAAERMLLLAAQYRRTMYGMLAVRSLFDQPAFDWKMAEESKAAASALAHSPAVRRAVALNQVGRPGLAERELRHYYPRIDRAMSEGLLAVAEELSLAGFQIRLASQLAQEDGQHRDRSLYPVPNWAPRSGFLVDRALLFALIRQESVFVADAKSRMGARGLMQLMPVTANFIEGRHRYAGAAADRLFAPELNMDLGQKYIRHLGTIDDIGNNVIFLLAAYNAGPNRLRAWLDEIDDGGDPLLFIESVPVRETRRHIRRVLANLWMYRHRLGQSLPSLQELAAGRWPTYRDLDRDRHRLAELGPVR